MIWLLIYIHFSEWNLNSTRMELGQYTSKQACQEVRDDLMNRRSSNMEYICAEKTNVK